MAQPKGQDKTSYFVLQTVKIFQKMTTLKEVELVAKVAHDNTNHKYNGLPYWFHLQEVFYITRDNINVWNGVSQDKSVTTDELLKAAWLHDIIEDCRYTYNDVKSIAGETVAEIVYAVTNEKGRNRAERGNDKYYDMIRSTPGAQYIKICDRIANTEYSKKSGSKMFEMYCKELPDFLEKVDPTRKYGGLLNKLISI